MNNSIIQWDKERLFNINQYIFIIINNNFLILYQKKHKSIITFKKNQNILFFFFFLFFLMKNKQISGKSVFNSNSIFQERPRCDGIEDEFTVENNNILIWTSQGVIVKRFTVSGSIHKVSWCQFIIDGEYVYYIAILHSEGLLLHSEEGSLQ